MNGNQPNRSPDASPLLLTPGPLTTSATVKEAMLRDCGARDAEFIELNRRICQTLLSLCDAGPTHLCVPLQGSGSFAVEAMLANQLPREGKLLNLANGAYGRRIAEMCRYLGRRSRLLETAEDRPIDTDALEQALAEDDAITHVAMVYCETTSGVLNPLAEVAEIVARHKRRLLLDAMSAFGALPLSVIAAPFEALAASANKCLQGVPGMGFVIAAKDSFPRAQGNAHSLGLDLYEQWRHMEQTGQWRFTPPTHCLLALEQALRELEAEGGAAGRRRRYEENCRALVEGMRALGFQTLLPDEWQAPVIATFLAPGDPAFDFQLFYQRLRALGYVIYPGKLTRVESFRMGCIGHLDAADLRGAVAAVGQALRELGVANAAPADSNAGASAP